MTTKAKGIHDHPRRPLGLKKHNKADHELLSIRWRGAAISYPAAVDYMEGVSAGEDNNTNIGDCGPTSGDNHNRVTTHFAGHEEDAPLDAVLELYRASSDPPFDPATGANDNGVDNPTLLSAMRKVGLNGKKIVAYGRLHDTSDSSLFAAIYMFKCVIMAVTLQVAQQDQSDATPPVWDYRRSAEWGGHDIAAAAYDAAKGTVDVFSWGERMSTTAAFRNFQMDEVWVPIWPELLTDPLFVNNVDMASLAEGFKSLTGKTLPVPSAPPVAPPVAPPTDAPGLTISVSDPEVQAHVESSAARSHQDVSAWADHHFRSYFGIK